MFRRHSCHPAISQLARGLEIESWLQGRDRHRWDVERDGLSGIRYLCFARRDCVDVCDRRACVLPDSPASWLTR